MIRGTAKLMYMINGAFGISEFSSFPLIPIKKRDSIGSVKIFLMRSGKDE
jgi:hypothetical protein